MSFRYKPEKNRLQEKISTLDDTHREYVKKFEHNRQSLSDKKKELQRLTDEIIILDNQSHENVVAQNQRSPRCHISINTTQTPDVVQKKAAIKLEIERLTSEIDDIMGCKSELDYYNKVDGILLRYYEIIDDSGPTKQETTKVNIVTDTPNESISKTDTIDVIPSKKVLDVSHSAPKKTGRRRVKKLSPTNKTILHFFGCAEEQLKSQKESTKQITDDQETINSPQKRKHSIETSDSSNDDNIFQDSNSSDYFSDNSKKMSSDEGIVSIDTSTNIHENKTPKNRAVLFDQYTRVIESRTPKKSKNIANYCEKCGIDRTLLQNDGVYVCTNCGEVENALIESEIHNYKDSVTEKPIYPYKRLNHLVECL